MTETVTCRRRWPWMVVVTVVLATGIPVAWRLRPLNQAERKLVGVWTEDIPKTDIPGRYQFRPDRTFLYELHDGDWGQLRSGHWWCSGDQLLLRDSFVSLYGWSDPVNHIRELIFDRPTPAVSPLQFDHEGRFVYFGTRFRAGTF